MPITINVLGEGEGIEFISSGVVTGEEIIAANQKIYTREILLHLRYKVIDRSQCTHYEVSADEIKAIAEQDRMAAKINPRILIALISTSSVQYGMSRMYEAYIDGIGFETEIFSDRESADVWLKKRLG